MEPDVKYAAFAADALQPFLRRRKRLESGMNLRHPSENRIKSEPGMETIPLSRRLDQGRCNSQEIRAQRDGRERMARKAHERLYRCRENT